MTTKYSKGQGVWDSLEGDQESRGDKSLLESENPSPSQEPGWRSRAKAASLESSPRPAPCRPYADLGLHPHPHLGVGLFTVDGVGT